jgi:hypothetical protein
VVLGIACKVSEAGERSAFTLALQEETRAVQEESSLRRANPAVGCAG